MYTNILLEIRQSIVHIVTPFYLQTWFMILAGVLFVFAGQWYFRFRTMMLTRRNEQLEKQLWERTVIIEKQTEELRKFDKTKSRFFDDVSHELHTPLSLIIGPLDSLLKQEYMEENNRRLLESVQSNARQLLNLVNEWPDLSKPEARKMEVKETIVNWFDVFQPTLDLFSSMSDSTSVDLLFDFRADTNLNIYLDLNKFEKIVRTILSNAMKFTPRGGKVELIADDLGEELRVTVRDNGPGIQPVDLPHVFDRFYQFDHQATQVEDITGIGMSLVKELAELLQGRVWVDSVPGQGSSFFFCFPRKTVEPEETQTVEFISGKDDFLPVPGELSSLDFGTMEEEPGKSMIIGAADTAWLKEVEALFKKNLTDTHCKVDWVAYAIHLSERQFSRRLKQLTGLAPNQYLREMRLQTAKDLLYAGQYTTVKEVSNAVGYMDTAYFSRQFRELFGVLPSEYLK